MKEVVNVSISGISFKIEEDAYSVLKAYLTELETFYGKADDGAEIVSDIEERIAELFIEREGKVRTISVEIVNEVVALLGHPREMEVDSEQTGQNCKKEAEPFKKLYRDLNDKVIGGVCSGLGAYFGVDPVMIRLIFVLLAFAASIFSWLNAWTGISINVMGGSSFGFMLLVYLLMWMITPAARTVVQRCAMRGKSAGIDSMCRNGGENRVNGGKCAEGIRVISNIILVCVGVCLIISGFAGLIAGMVLLFGFEVAESLSIISIVDYIELGVGNTLWLKFLALSAYFIPFVGMLYGGVMLCFRFKAPKWHPGLIMFLLWIASLFGLTSVGIKSAAPYMSHSNWSDDRPIVTGSDTLYIKSVPFEGIEESASSEIKSRDDIRADYIVGKGKEKQFVKYPKIRIVKHTPKEGEEYKPFVELKSIVYEGVGAYHTNRPVAMESICSVRDSILEVYPRFYTKEKKFNGEGYTIWVHAPATMTVILTDEKGKVSYYDE